MEATSLVVPINIVAAFPLRGATSVVPIATVAAVPLRGATFSNPIATYWQLFSGGNFLIFSSPFAHWQLLSGGAYIATFTAVLTIGGYFSSSCHIVTL
jgi:hypothetical protein